MNCITWLLNEIQGYIADPSTFFHSQPNEQSKVNYKLERFSDQDH